MPHELVSGRRVRRLRERPMNEAIDNARNQELFGNRTEFTPASGQYLISVRNDTEEEVFQRYAPVGLDNSLILPDDNEPAFIGSVNLGAVVPTFEHVSRFAITQEPISPGRMGKALLYGITPAKVDLTSLQHQYAQPKDGEAELQSVDFGGARIIWPHSPVSLGEQWCLVLLTGNGQATTGERISGTLVTPLAAAQTTTGGGREPGTALLRVYSTDPDNSLETQTRNRYDITGVTPTDPDDIEAGQSFEVAQDLRFRLVPHHPFQIIESTSRDGTYKVESITWDGTKSIIATENAIPVVLDEDEEPVVDGVLLIPGGDRRIPSDRYEIVQTYSNRAAARNAWVEATHDGNAYIVGHLDW